MRVTVLGKSPSWQDAGGACSGYLIEHGGTVVLLDCGNGVFGKLRARIDYATVDAVVLSHLHADHFLDLVPFAYALTFGTGAGRRPVLHAPAGAHATFRRLCGSWGPEDLIESAFDLREYTAADELEVGALHARFAEVTHFTTTHAVELGPSGGGGRFTFGADTGPDEALVAFARETDLLLLEATLPAPEPDGPRGHLTAREAGEHARRAQARRLVLTHVSDELDLDHVRAEAADAYGAAVEVAVEGAAYEV